MANSPLVSARYPVSSSAPNVNQDIQNAVLDLEDGTYAGPFASTAARDTAFNNWVALGNTMRDGLHCHVTGVGDQVYIGGAWLTNYTKSGVFSGSSDASGNITVTHGLAVTPTVVFIQGRTAGSVDAQSFAVTAITSTTFTAKVYYNGAQQVSLSAPCYWLVRA